MGWWRYLSAFRAHFFMLSINTEKEIRTIWFCFYPCDRKRRHYNIRKEKYYHCNNYISKTGRKISCHSKK